MKFFAQDKLGLQGNVFVLAPNMALSSAQDRLGTRWSNATVSHLGVSGTCTLLVAK